MGRSLLMKKGFDLEVGWQNEKERIVDGFGRNRLFDSKRTKGFSYLLAQ
jgi:hypothetical protein